MKHLLDSTRLRIPLVILTYHGCRTIFNLNNDDIIRFFYYFRSRYFKQCKKKRLVGVNDWLLDQCFVYNSAQTFSQVKWECRLNATDFEHKHLKKKERKMNCSAYKKNAISNKRHTHVKTNKEPRTLTEEKMKLKKNVKH